MDGSPFYFNLNALQQKNRWAFEVPRGTFVNLYDGTVDADADRAARDAVIARMARRWFRLRDIVERDGVTYYKRDVLARIRDHVTDDAQRAMLSALLHCMDAAERDRTIVKGKPERTGLSPDQRQQMFGHNRARGIAWTPQEDAVLRRWFGIRTFGEHQGKHMPLTPEQWNMVLDEDLRGVRSKNSVQQRLSALNHQLLNELLARQHLHYGLKKGPKALRRAFVPEYMRRVLGERPRKPPMMPERDAGRRNDVPASPDVGQTLESRWADEFKA